MVVLIMHGDQLAGQTIVLRCSQLEDKTAVSWSHRHVFGGSVMGRSVSRSTSVRVPMHADLHSLS